MKTEAEIRKLLEYLSNLTEHNFSDDSYDTYTSPFLDENGKETILAGKEASEVLSNMSLVRETLDWILEQPIVHKNENELLEARRRGLRILVDGNRKREIPDISPEAFITCWIEGRIYW